jgi:hypothetical protein
MPRFGQGKSPVAERELAALSPIFGVRLHLHTATLVVDRFAPRVEILREDNIWLSGQRGEGNAEVDLAECV